MITFPDIRETLASPVLERPIKFNNQCMEHNCHRDI